MVNVGAGTGSYEPRDRWVPAVEPSATMRAQRSPDAPPCLAGASADLASGRWDEENGALRGQVAYEGALRLVISEPA